MSGFYTYLHCKPGGEIFYVGKGSGNRAYQLRHQRNRFHKNVVSKYGEENIKVYIFECESEEEAYRDEIHQINHLRRDGFELVNLSEGGKGGIRGMRHSDETKRKIAIAKLGNKCGLGNKSRTGIPSTDRQKEISSLVHKGNGYNVGRKQSHESNEKRSSSLKGRKISEGTRLKMSTSAKVLWEKRKSLLSN